MISLNAGYAFVIAYLVSNALRIYAVSRYMRCFLGDIRYSKGFTVIMYMVYFMVNSFGFIVMEELVVNILSNFLCCLAVACMYRGSLERRVLATALINGVNIGWDSVIGAALLPTDMLFITSGMMTSICVLLTGYAIQKFMSFKESPSVGLSGHAMVLFAIPIASIALAFVNYRFRYHNPLTVINLVGLLFIDIMVFRIYEYLLRMNYNWYREKLANEQNEAHRHQYHIQQESIEQMRRFRHDIKIHIQSLMAILWAGNVPDAMSYLVEMSDFVKPAKEIVSTGNTDIDSILNYKLSNAAEQGIAVKATVFVPDRLPVKAFDLSVILSNLIDNAVEATVKCEEKRITVVMRTEGNILYIAIENTYHGEVIKDRGRLVTHKDDKENHGFGTENVRSVVEKYGGELSFRYGDGIFHATLYIVLAEC